MEEEVCSICLDPLTEGGDIREMAECGHLFHQRCVDMWLSQKGECPNCKSN